MPLRRQIMLSYVLTLYLGSGPSGIIPVHPYYVGRDALHWTDITPGLWAGPSLYVSRNALCLASEHLEANVPVTICAIRNSTPVKDHALGESRATPTSKLIGKKFAEDCKLRGEARNVSQANVRMTSETLIV